MTSNILQLIYYLLLKYDIFKKMKVNINIKKLSQLIILLLIVAAFVGGSSSAYALPTTGKYQNNDNEIQYNGQTFYRCSGSQCNFKITVPNTSPEPDNITFLNSNGLYFSKNLSSIITSSNTSFSCNTIASIVGNNGSFIITDQDINGSSKSTNIGSYYSIEKPAYVTYSGRGFSRAITTCLGPNQVTSNIYAGNNFIPGKTINLSGFSTKNIPTINATFVDAADLYINKNQTTTSALGQYLGQLFHDNNNDQNHIYFLNGAGKTNSQGFCQPIIAKYNSSSTFGLFTNQTDPCTGYSYTTGVPIAILKLSNSNYQKNDFIFGKVNNSTEQNTPIYYVWNNSLQFNYSRSISGHLFVDNCSDSINITNLNLSSQNTGTFSLVGNQSTCSYKNSATGATYATGDKINISPASQYGPGGSSSIAAMLKNTGSGGTTPATCISSGFSLNWIICGVINGIANGISSIYTGILQPLLLMNDSNFLTPGSQYFSAWSSFRVIANILLVIILLIVVFGESIGGGLIDAYSIKKIVPRLVLMVIVANISLYLVVALVDIVNILGTGIVQLLEAPFKSSGTMHYTITGTVGSFGGQVTALLIGGGAVAGIWGLIAAGGAGALLSSAIPFVITFILLPTILFALATIITLVLRQVIIIFLAIVSPVAFILYILPNTEKYFKKWWDSLFKALLVYPIVFAVFALSQIFMGLISNGQFSGLSGFGQDILMLITIFIPLFLIPFSFKLSGGLVGTAYGAINGSRKKLQEKYQGDPRDPDSRRNRHKRKLKAGLLQASDSVSKKNSFLSRRLVTPRHEEAMARYNAEHARAVDQVLATGDDSFAMGSTVPLSYLSGDKDELKARGDYKVDDNGKGKWKAANGSWYDESTIRKGHKEYSDNFSRQKIFAKALDKTEGSRDPQAQERALKMFGQTASQAGVNASTIDGGIKGMTTPRKWMDMSLKHTKFVGDENGYHPDPAGFNHEGLLADFSSSRPGDLIAQRPNFWKQLNTSVTTMADKATSLPAGSAERDAIESTLKAVYSNYENYISPGPTSPSINTASPGNNNVPAGVVGNSVPYTPGSGNNHTPSASSSYGAINQAAAQNAQSARDNFNNVKAKIGHLIT